MPALKVEEVAIADLANIIDYISKDNPGAGEVLDIEIREKISLLPIRPRLYRLGRVKDTREMVVRGNFIVVYSEAPEVVTVLRVLHAAQRWP